MLTTTLAEIRSHSPCAAGFAKVRDHFGVSEVDAKTHAEPFPVALLLETNNLSDALWVFDRVAPQAVKDAFMIRRLDTGDHSALKTLRSIKGDWTVQIAAVESVVALLHRRIGGEDVTAEMKTADAAADAAARAAAYAAARAAAYAAAYAAASAAAYAAAYAAASAAADAAARAAAYAAARAAASAAADAAARADLIAVLNAA